MVLLPLIGVAVAMVALGAALIGIMLIIVFVVLAAAGASTFVAIMTGTIGSTAGVFVRLLPVKKLWARSVRSYTA